MLAVLVAIVGAAAYLLRDTPPPAPLDDAELSRLIADKRAELSMAERTAPVGSSEAAGTSSLLYVDSNPSGAVVLLDADTVGITPLDGRTVKTGVYVLSIRKDDFAPRDTVIFVLEEDVVPRHFFDLAPAGSYDRDDALIASRVLSSPDLGRSGATADPERTGTRAQAPRRPVESTRDRQIDSPSEQSRSARENVASARSEAGERSPRTSARQSSDSPETTAALSNESPAPLTGLVTVRVRPWGSIYIDGQLEKLNTDVQHTAALPEGRHVVRVEHPALGMREQVVEIRNDQPRHVVFDLLESDVGGAEPQNARPERAERVSGGGSSGDDGS